jgi:hypothetical protein
VSQAEVEAVLGGPPGDFTTETVGYIIDGMASGPRTRWEDWSANQGLIAVAFDERGRVQHSTFCPALRWGPTPLAERVRDWFRPVWP